MVRQWKRANKIIAEAEAKRRAAGLPEPKLYEDPFTVGLFSLLGVSLLTIGSIWVTTWLLTPGHALRAGIVFIVLLGATGLVLRGAGELSQGRARYLKAYGYFAGAMAYLATASVALFNAAPALLQRR